MARSDHSEARGDGKGLSQTIFVLVTLAISAGGLWTLYLSDAPYHPQDAVSRGDTQLIGN